jgi:hypothetical protein
MNPEYMEYWQAIGQEAALKFLHLNIVLEEWDLTIASTLLGNPFRENNHLHSILLDVSRVTTASPLDFFRTEGTAFKLVLSLVKASHGCVDKVSLLFGVLEDKIEDFTISIVKGRLKGTQSCRIITNERGENVRLCVWLVPHEEPVVLQDPIYETASLENDENDNK